MLKGVLYILLVCIALPVAGQTIELPNNQPIKVTNQYNVLFDSSEALQLKDVVKLQEQKSFKSIEEFTFNKGYHVYWLYFKIRNNTGLDGEWVMDFHNWSFVDVYTRDSVLRHERTGHLTPYAERSFAVANNAYVLSQIKNGETKEYFVRLESRYNNEMVPEGLGFAIAPRSVISELDSRRGKIIYSFMSVFFVAFLYNLFIYFITRARSYFYYVVVIFFIFYHTAYNSGFIIELFRNIRNFPIWLRHFETFSSTLFGMSILLFASEFLNVKSRYPLWDRIIKYILASYLVFGVLLVIDQDTGTITTSISGLATIISIIIIAVKSIRDKYPAAKYFLIGYSAFLASTLVIILSYLEVIPQNDWTFSYSLPLGSVFLIVFFSFALANMIKLLQQKNAESQRQHLELLQEKAQMNLYFQKEILQTKLETHEQTLSQVGKELHDNIQQLLSSARFLLGSAERSLAEVPETIKSADLVLEKAIGDLRMLTKTIDNDYIKQFDLLQNLRTEVERINMARGNNEEGLHIQINPPVSPMPLNAEAQLVLFRVIQEALQNILKHAHAHSLQITFSNNDHLHVAICDDGKGFHMDEAKVSSMGLRNMRNRIGLLGGTITWHSEPNVGTQVMIKLPI